MLIELDEPLPSALRTHVALSFACMHAVAAGCWSLKVRDAAQTLVWSMLESRALAAVKLVPLGQSVAQRVLLRLGRRLPEAVNRALALPDDAIGGSLPMLSLLSMQHETAYTRLFRS